MKTYRKTDCRYSMENTTILNTNLASDIIYLSFTGLKLKSKPSNATCSSSNIQSCFMSL